MISGLNLNHLNFHKLIMNFAIWFISLMYQRISNGRRDETSFVHLLKNFAKQMGEYGEKFLFLVDYCA